MASWQTICPIWSRYKDAGNLDEPFNFGRRVSIGRIERFPLSQLTLSDLNRDDREDAKRARVSFLAEYEADGFGDPDPEWKGSQPRSIQKNSHERIQFANLALWLTKPSALGFQVIAHQCGDQSHSLTEWRIKASDSYVGALLTRSDLEAARPYFLTLCDLTRTGPVWVAVRALFKALVDDEELVRFPLLWVGLEALFGPTEGYKVTKKIVRRTAWFFAEGDGADPNGTARKVVESYWWRGAVVHGSRIPGDEDAGGEAYMAILDAEFVFRAALRKILTSPELIEIFASPGRDSFLEERVPSGFEIPEARRAKKRFVADETPRPSA